MIVGKNLIYIIINSILCLRGNADENLNITDEIVALLNKKLKSINLN